jgi:Na+/glutamate symporter
VEFGGAGPSYNRGLRQGDLEACRPLIGFGNFLKLLAGSGVCLLPMDWLLAGSVDLERGVGGGAAWVVFYKKRRALRG